MPDQATHSNGRVALVTGATGIIGPALCATLQRDGWRVAACGTSEQGFSLHEKLFGQPVRAEAYFVSRLKGRDTAYTLVHDVEEKLGPVALLVNNAATNPTSTTLQEISESYCERMIQTNLLSPLWLCQAAEPSLVAQRGSIVNISSVRVCRPGPKNILYPVTKAALENLTMVLAMELGPKGVRVNAIRVGTVPGTAFMREALEKLPAETARQMMEDILPHHWAADRSLSTTGRAGYPQDIAEAVAFLASSKAEFFNAAILPLEGGFSFSADDPAPEPKTWNSARAVADWLASKGIKL